MLRWAGLLKNNNCHELIRISRIDWVHELNVGAYRIRPRDVDETEGHELSQIDNKSLRSINA